MASMRLTSPKSSEVYLGKFGERHEMRINLSLFDPI
jgi:hypothetical protein